MDRDDPNPGGNEVRDESTRAVLDRKRNELLRQEVEVVRRERDVTQREAAAAQRELELVNAGRPGIGRPEERNLVDDLRRHQLMEAEATPPQLRADVKGIGELLGEFDGTNR